MYIEQNAPVIARDRIAVAAPLETVWNLFTDINGWSNRNKDIENASLDAPLAVGATFRWTTAGMNIVSTVGELIPQKRIAWSGVAMGITGVHVWKFSETGKGTIVETAESWSGEPIETQIAAMQKALNQFLRSWLENIKREAESE